jgi:hypothetical protein
MNIGKRRRTIYIEPIEEPSTAPSEEPSTPIEQDPSAPLPEAQPDPTR